MHPWWLFSYVYLYLSDSHMYASVSVNFLAQIVSLYIAQAGGSAGTGASGVGAREQRGLGGRGSDAARACRPGAAAGPNGGFSLFMATRRVYFLFSFLCAAFFVDEPTHLDLV
jgi:hypothetical protein